MTAEESVLVIPTLVLHDAGLFQGLCRDVEYYVSRLLNPAYFSFLPRGRAEEDPSFKQLIPYVVLKHGEQVFHYTRGKGGGEKRLRSLRSIGIGGHINPIDQAAGKHAYREGMLREVREEVAIDAGYREWCLGFINDDATPVGQVHLGIVHVFELDAPIVQRREADIAEAGFSPIRELVRELERFESWSRFVLTVLDK